MDVILNHCPAATLQWLVENYEPSDSKSLPRCTLYEHYKKHCNQNKLYPVNSSLFGKLIRNVFQNVKTKRLGARGNTKYHYYGIRIKPGSYLLREPHHMNVDPVITPRNTMLHRDIANRSPISPDDPPGVDCFGDDRESLSDMAEYFNNAHLSDVTILVFPAHRMILAKSSDVFDRMLSQRWNGESKQELELLEESPCQRVFSSFLRFLYCNHLVLHQDNCLPVLMLADKYNVVSLKKVCIEYTISELLSVLPLEELFTVWFPYATKAYHPYLTRACILSIDFDLLLSEECENSWMSLDRDHLLELLKCNQLIVANEYRLWEGVVRWLQAPAHPERRGTTATPLLRQILPLVRFAFMSADELSLVERSPIAEAYPELIHPLVLLAYKWQALPLASRLNQKKFRSTHFLLRQYTDIRWDKRITVTSEQSFDKGIEHAFRFSTRSCSFPLRSWQWTLNLKLCSSSSTTADDRMKAYLVAENMDSPRAIEYMLSIVDDEKVIKSFVGKKNFTKARNSTEIDMDRLEMNELLSDDSLMLFNGQLQLQLHIVLKPIG